MVKKSDMAEGLLLDDDNASYDRAAKRLLSMKPLLAWILKYLVAEFKDTSLRDIETMYIEGEPSLSVGTIPVDADFTNAYRKTAQAKTPANTIHGTRNEDSSITEGMVVFDILFRAVVPATGEPITLIINIEPQRSAHTGYALIRRAIYYACRLISSQKETEFHGDNFNGIKKVYTIWLLMDTNSRGKNSIARYQISEKMLLGHRQEAPKHYDLLVAVMVHLGKESTRHKLLRLLHLIFLRKGKATEKKKILREEYDLSLTPSMEKELTKMGSLAIGIAEQAAIEGEKRGIALGEKRGIALGEKRGIALGIRQGERMGREKGETIMMDALRMIKNDMPFAAIHKKTGLTVERLTELKSML